MLRLLNTMHVISDQLVRFLNAWMIFIEDFIGIEVHLQLAKSLEGAP
jgi:hypothetical protein